MRKRVTAGFMGILMILMTVFTCFVPGMEVQAAGKTLIVHYGGRADDNYEGWNLWLWEEGKDGQQVDFTDTDDYGQVAVYQTNRTPASIGFIVRLNQWEDKDIADDRFVTMDGDTVEIWLTSGEAEYATQAPDGAATYDLQALEEARLHVYEEADAAKLNIHYYNFAQSYSKDTIEAYAWAGTEVGGSYPYVETDDEGNAYPVAQVEIVNDKEITLIMEEELALSKAYSVNRQGYEGCSVSMDKIIGSTYFDEELAYDGDDLGAVYTKEKTTFRIWAPTAVEVSLNLYEQGDGDNLMETIPMTADVKGTWVCEKTGDLNGVYYTYSVKIGNKVNEVVDLYARSAGVNGNRGEILDLEATNPDGFDADVRPAFSNATDAVIYELHIRDLSSDASSGIQNTGKFLGLTERGTKNSEGLATGLDHILDLGVTHVQILPSYDYATVDETKLDTAQFNWGYDPKNYNIPEGSYSTDPYHGEVRVNEMKQMIQTLHANGIRVNMDVVYNHTYNLADSWFQKTVPDYYYRKNGDNYSNGSGCGNETASERAMMRKYIVDSVVYWATEYHVDGFRFDLMGVHDLDTMKAVREALDQVDPSIMVYGEGWTGGESALPAAQQATKNHIYQLDRVGAFSDDIRDGIKGNVFDSLDKGFVSGKEGMEESIKFGVVAATPHPQVMISKNDKKSTNWSGQPGQSINYISCHDNLTFWDKLAISNADDSEADRVKMNKLGSAIILTSQGVPFMQAGEEMLRSKPNEKSESGFDENSYCSPDATNSIKWDNKGNVIDTYEYYKGLIVFRKAHSALRMTTATDIQNTLTFMSGLDANVVAYTIKGEAQGETAQNIAVIYNGNPDAVTVNLPAGTWDICVNGEKAGCESLGTAEGSVTVEGISAMVLVQGDDTLGKASAKDEQADTTVENAQQTKGGISTPVAILVAILVIAVIVAVVLIRRKK